MYGLEVLGYTEQDSRDRADPMAVVFPKVFFLLIFFLKELYIYIFFHLFSFRRYVVLN